MNGVAEAISVEQLADRACSLVARGDGALVTVTRERSLFLRFAASRSTQSTAIEDVDVTISVLRDGHVGGASTNRLTLALR